MDQQVFQHGPFARAQVDGQQLSLALIVLRRLARAGAAACRVQLDGTEAEDGRCGCLRAAQQRAQPGQQFGKLEGLDHVVVGALVQALHAVLQRIARRQDQHGHGRALDGAAAQAACELQPVDARQADVDHGQVEGFLGQHLQGALGTADPVHGIPRIGQPQLDAAGHHHIVFHKKQTHIKPKKQKPPKGGLQQTGPGRQTTPGPCTMVTRTAKSAPSGLNGCGSWCRRPGRSGFPAAWHAARGHR